MTTLAFQRLHDAAKLPTRGFPADAGLDLASVEVWTIPPGGQARVDTGLAVALPADHAGLIWPRSGLAMRGVSIMGGCIDPQYSGPIGVILRNDGTEDLRVEVGTRIAQLLVVPIARLEPTWVEALPESERGADGFGSSDRRAS